MDQGIIDLAYQRLAAAIPEGVNKGGSIESCLPISCGHHRSIQRRNRGEKQ